MHGEAISEDELIEVDEGVWKDCIKFHGHQCPGLAIGFRASEHGLSLLGIPWERARDEEIVCLSENEACGVDAIQFVTGCTAGKGNLMFIPMGKSAYTFYDRNSGKGVRLVLREFDRDEDREVVMNRILSAPLEDVFEVKEPLMDLPEKARIFNSVRCEDCGELSREDKIRLEEGRMLCLHCFQPYDRG